MSESATEEKEKPKTLFQKILDVIVTVVVVLVVILAVLVVIVTIISKKSPDSATNIFGYQMRTILTGSMEKCKHDDPNEECTHIDVSKYDIGNLPVNTMIFIELVPESEAAADKWYEKLKEGDVLTFQYEGIGVVTHRIVKKEQLASGGYEIQLMGDNRGSDGTAGVQTIITDKKNSVNYVIGKVVGQSEFLGNVVYIIKQPIGAMFVILIPCLIIVIVEIVKIISILAQSKKEKALEKNAAIEAETETVKNDIEELKRQIALAQQALDTTGEKFSQSEDVPSQRLPDASEKDSEQDDNDGK